MNTEAPMVFKQWSWLLGWMLERMLRDVQIDKQMYKRMENWTPIYAKQAWQTSMKGCPYV